MDVSLAVENALLPLRMKGLSVRPEGVLSVGLAFQAWVVSSLAWKSQPI